MSHSPFISRSLPEGYLRVVLASTKLTAAVKFFLQNCRLWVPHWSLQSRNWQSQLHWLMCIAKQVSLDSICGKVGYSELFHILCDCHNLVSSSCLAHRNKLNYKMMQGKSGGGGERSCIGWWGKQETHIQLTKYGLCCRTCMSCHLHTHRIYCTDWGGGSAFHFPIPTEIEHRWTTHIYVAIWNVHIERIIQYANRSCKKIIPWLKNFL